MRRLNLAVLSLGVAVTCISCSCRTPHGQNRPADDQVIQASSLSDGQMARLKELENQKTVMGIRVVGDTVFVSTGLLPQEKLDTVKAQVQAIVGGHYKVAFVIH